MAFDSIAGISFVFVDGVLDPPATELEPLVRPGEDSVAFKALGARGVSARLIAGRDYQTAAEAQGALETYKELIGTNVTIVQHGLARTGFCVISVREREGQGGRFTGALASGGVNDGKHWLETEWQVQHAEPT